MSYWARLVVGLGLIVASATMFVYSLVELVTHIHGSCGSGTDTDTGVTLSPCPHNTAFWIIALVVSVFIFIAGVIGYAGRGSPPARTREADVSSSGLPGLGPVSMAPMAAAPAPTPAAVAASNVADQIQQLQQLKDGGLLDDDEFKKARAKILGGRP